MCPAPDRALAAAALLACTLAVPARAAAQGTAPLARLSLVEHKVELERKGARWQAAVEGGPLQLGDALRTGPDAVARLDLPWMALTLSPGTTVRFPDAFLLSGTLERGRAVVEAEGRDALKLVTAEAEVRGRGRAVVRREGRATLVTCLSGRFFVTAAEASVTLAPGQGTVVATGREPSTPEAAPLAPKDGLWPSGDPAYAAAGEPVELRWLGDAAAYQVELLPVGSEVVLLQRDVAASPLRLAVPWEGAFRWRVSARDRRGLEGAPSAEGLIAVDAR